MHLYPRFAGDPYEGGPIDGRASFVRGEAEPRRIIAALADA
jgi:hypothetical protein